MHPFQWCNGESRGGRALGSPETRRGARLRGRQRLVLRLQPSFPRNGAGGKASWSPTLFCTARDLKNKQTNKSPGLPRGPGRVSERASVAGLWEPRGPRPLCGGFALLSLALPLCAQTLLCCGCWRRIKSALGLGSPRGSSSSRPETLQAILNMHTMLRAGRAGPGVASSVFVGFALAAVGLCACGSRRIKEHGFTELIELCRYLRARLRLGVG